MQQTFIIVVVETLNSSLTSRRYQFTEYKIKMTLNVMDKRLALFGKGIQSSM